MVESRVRNMVTEQYKGSTLVGYGGIFEKSAGVGSNKSCGGRCCYGRKAHA